jgi:hypothetical protein
MDLDPASGIAALLIGCGATLVMDLWAVLLKRLFGVAPLDYALVGRWIGHLRHGQFTHRSIAAAPAVSGEAMLGWFAHYAIGVLFAGLLLAIWGISWAREPTLGPALIVGVGSIVAPFFILQPGLGAGIAARKTPRPNITRLRSLATHVSFGIGLYIAAVVTAPLLPA